MNHKIRRNRQKAATGVPASAPQPPHAAPVLTTRPTGTAGHAWLPDTVQSLTQGLRRDAQNCLGEADDTDTRAYELTVEAAGLSDEAHRLRARAADLLRAADLVERDAAGVPDAVLRPGPAMGRDLLLNGVQPGTGPDEDGLLHGGRAWHPDTRPAVEPRPSRDGDTETLPVVRVPAEVIR